MMRKVGHVMRDTAGCEWRNPRAVSPKGGAVPALLRLQS